MAFLRHHTSMSPRTSSGPPTTPYRSPTTCHGRHNWKFCTLSRSSPARHMWFKGCPSQKVDPKEVLVPKKTLPLIYKKVFFICLEIWFLNLTIKKNKSEIQGIWTHNITGYRHTDPWTRRKQHKHCLKSKQIAQFACFERARGMHVVFTGHVLDINELITLCRL